MEEKKIRESAEMVNDIIGDIPNYIPIDWLCKKVLNYNDDDFKKIKIVLKREQKLKRILNGRKEN